MYQTFNMGIGMEVIVKSLADAEKVISNANKYDISASIIGHTETSEDGKNSVLIGENVYNK